MGWGARHTGSLPLQRRGWARSCAQMGARLKLSPSGLHRAGLPPEVTPPEDPGPHSHPPGCPQRDPAVWPECEHGLCGLGGGQISAELQPWPSPGPPCSPGPLTARDQALPAPSQPRGVQVSSPAGSTGGPGREGAARLTGWVLSRRYWAQSRWPWYSASSAAV